MTRPLFRTATALLGCGLVGALLTSFARAQTVTPAPTAPTATPAVIAPTTAVAGAAPAPTVNVNEAHPDPLGVAPRTLAGWAGLWAQLPTSTAELRIALLEIQRAEAATRIAYGAVLPSLNGSVTLSYSPRNSTGTVIVTGDTLSMQLQATAPLVNLRAFHNIGTVKDLEEIAWLSSLEVRRRLGLSLARAAVSIAAAVRLAEGNRQGVEAAIERLSLTRKRLAAGVGDMRDLVRAQQDVAASRAIIAPADESLRQAREGLGTILAIPGEVGVAGDLPALEKEVVEFCGNDPATKEPERLDIVIAKKQIEIAKRNVDDITLKFVPTLTASASAGVLGQPFGNGNWTPGWSIGVNLSIPFFDGGVRYGEKKDRLAVVEQQKARALQVEIAAMIEKAQARRALDVAAAAQASAKEARDLAKEADRLAQLAYAGGVGTNFDLIDAGRRLRETETTLVLRDLDLVRARIALPFVEGRCVGVSTTPKPAKG